MYGFFFFFFVFLHFDDVMLCIPEHNVTWEGYGLHNEPINWELPRGYS